jgi:hypothetical protein
VGYEVGSTAIANNSTQVLAAWALHQKSLSPNVGSVWVSLYSSGKWLADPVPVHKPISDGTLPIVVAAVLDGRGHGFVVWCREVGAKTYELYASRLSHGLWQDVPSQLNNRHLSNAKAELFVDALGQVTAIWMEDNQFALRRFE